MELPCIAVPPLDPTAVATYEAACERAKRKEVATEDPPDIMCKQWRDVHGVAPGVTWGSLPGELKQRWGELRCDTLLKN